MKFKEAIKRFRKRLRFAREDQEMDMPLEFQKLIQMIDNTQETELSCEDVYQLLDQYADLIQQSKNAPELMPLVEHHIKICPDCREEFEALLRILQSAPA